VDFGNREPGDYIVERNGVSRIRTWSSTATTSWSRPRTAARHR